MKTFLRVLVKILVVLVCIGALLYFVRNFIARKSVEVGVRTVTGFPMKIETVKLAGNLQSLDMANLRMENPEGFEEKHFLDLAAMHATYKLGSILMRSPHITELSLDIPKVTIVRNKDGIYNVMRLASIESARRAGTGTEKDTKYRVDKLTIKIGTVQIEDYIGGKHTQRVIPLNKERTFIGLTESTQIPRLALVMIMDDIPLPNLGIDLNDLKAHIGNVTDATGKVIKDTGEAVGEAGKGVMDSIKKVLPGQEKK